VRRNPHLDLVTPDGALELVPPGHRRREF